MSDYLRIPLPKRLEAFRRANKEHLGGGWHTDKQHEPGKKKWHWVPQGFRDANGCWGGAAFEVGSDTCKWCENLTGYFRNVTDAHDLIRLGHTGWYVDIRNDETTKGQVLQLPARHGKTLFMAACTDPCNANTGIVELCLYDDKDTAARGADQLAERYGEDCREDDLKSHAEAHIEELKQEITDTRTHIKELVAGLRESKLAKVVCDEMRSTIRKLRSTVRSKKARIERITDEPWTVHPDY